MDELSLQKQAETAQRGKTESIIGKNIRVRFFRANRETLGTCIGIGKGGLTRVRFLSGDEANYPADSLVILSEHEWNQEIQNLKA